jgi:hypothetical protein
MVATQEDPVYVMGRSDHETARLQRQAQLYGPLTRRLFIEAGVGSGMVLVRCRGHEYLHLVKARQGERFLIGNNRGSINRWVGRRAIFGLATKC